MVSGMHQPLSQAVSVFAALAGVGAAAGAIAAALALWQGRSPRRGDPVLPPLAAALLLATAAVILPVVAQSAAGLLLAGAALVAPVFLVVIGRLFPAESNRLGEGLIATTAVLTIVLGLLPSAAMAMPLYSVVLGLNAGACLLGLITAGSALRAARPGARAALIALLVPLTAAGVGLADLALAGDARLLPLPSPLLHGLLGVAWLLGTLILGGLALSRLAAALAATQRLGGQLADLTRAFDQRVEDATRTLRQERDRLHTVLNLLPVGVVIIDARGAIAGLNRAAEALFGMTVAEATGRPALDLVGGAWAERFARALDRSRRQSGAGDSRTGEFDIEVRRRNGSAFPARVALEALPPGPDGFPAGYLGLVRDITAQRQDAVASDAQARATAERAVLLDHLEPLAGAGHALWTVPGGRLTCSAGLLRLLGRDGRLIATNPPGTLDDLAAAFSPADRDRLLALAADASWMETNCVLRVNGGAPAAQGRSLALHLWRRQGNADAPGTTLCLALDITDRQRLDSALRQAEAAERRASHAGPAATAALGQRLRPSVTTLLGLVREVLAESLDDTQRDALEDASVLGSAVAAQLESALARVQPLAAAPPPDEDAVDARRLLRTAADVLAPQAEARGLGLHQEAAASLPPALVGDSIRLLRIILDLGDSLLAAADHGTLTLRAALGEDAHPQADGRPSLVVPVVFDLTVPGETMPAPLAPEDPLRRLAIGLGGELRPLPPAGRRIGWRLTLGMRRLAGGTPSRPSPPQSAVPAAGRRLLLVEDVEINRRVALAFARRAGHAVEAVETGADAVARVAEAAAEGQPFDLVLMDIRLPDFDGTEACRRIRALPDPVAARVPILALTANVFANDQEAYRLAGMQGVIAKPIQAEEFSRALAAALAPASQPIAEGETPPSGPAGEPGSEDALDIPFIDERLRTLGVDTFLTILRLSRRGMAEAVQALADAAEAGDDSDSIRQLGRAGHKVAGAASNFGFSGLFALGRQVERLAEAGESAPARAAARLAAHRLAQGLAALDAWLAAHDLDGKAG